LEISYLQDTQYVYPWFLKDIRTNRLISIDALRGIAALSVVFFHVHLFVYPQNIPVTSLWLKVIQFPLNFGLLGRTGVILFFVLSGFCIHLRWAKQKAAGEEQPIDFLQFWKRRMWRLYPTYSVVLIFSVGLALALGYFHFNEDFFNSLFAHLLMVQNFQPTWSTDFNPPFWTLAIEEQLYLIYFILLWLRNKFGWRNAVLSCIGSRLLWNCAGWMLIPFGYHIFLDDGAFNFWFIWALGAVAVESWLGLVKLPAWTKELKWACLLLNFSMLLEFYKSQNITDATNIWFYRGFMMILDPLWGVGYFILVNYFVSLESKWKESGAIAFAVRKLADVGLFSYSLYLTHQIWMEHFPFRALHLWTGISDSGIRWSVTILLPLISLYLAWILFQLIERHFMVPYSEWRKSK